MSSNSNTQRREIIYVPKASQLNKNVKLNLKSYVMYMQQDSGNYYFNEFGNTKTSYYHYINPYCCVLSHSVQFCVCFSNISIKNAFVVDWRKVDVKSLQSSLMATVFHPIKNKVWLPFSWAFFQPACFLEGGEVLKSQRLTFTSSAILVKCFT